MRFSTYTAVSALAALASAQTFTDCNPTEKECPNDPSMPKTFETDFTKGKDAIKGWKQTAGSLTYSPGGAEFTVAKKGDAPTIQSEGYLHFGYVEVKMKAAPGQGIISSIVLQSDNLDEVDWEWIGGVDTKVQMNYFGKGNTTTFDRMIEAPLPSTQNEVHTYALNWTAEALTWLIDAKPVRTLNFADANGGKNFPQTPCNVRLGNWPGGDSENEGTRQWAGGVVDYAGAPFTMTVESIKVINYSPGKEYNWSDKSGSFGSIKVVDAGNEAGAPVNDKVLEASAAAPGVPLESGFAAPTATGATNGTAPAQSQFNYPTGAAGSKPVNGTGAGAGADGKPCDCGTAYVTVTGAPPASKTSVAVSSGANTPATTAIATATATATATVRVSSGLMKETRPAPSVPMPSAPSGGIPEPSAPVSVPVGASNGTASVSAPPAQFTGAAGRNAVGLAMGVVVGAVVLAF